MNSQSIKCFIISALVLITTALLSGLIIQLLWNGSVIDVFNVNRITFWQSVQFYLLIKFLLDSYTPSSKPD